MMAFVYAHRHNKDDKFILETKQAGFIDFSIVRDVMYKYSKKAQDRFFEQPIEAYFFAKFAQLGREFIQNKEKTMTKDCDFKLSKLMKNTDSLQQQAIASLKKASSEKNENASLIAFFLRDL